MQRISTERHRLRFYHTSDDPPPDNPNAHKSSFQKGGPGGAAVRAPV